LELEWGISRFPEKEFRLNFFGRCYGTIRVTCMNFSEIYRATSDLFHLERNGGTTLKNHNSVPEIEIDPTFDGPIRTIRKRGSV